MMTSGRAPAKINLTLHVTDQRADGYHLLDSLVVFADMGDELALTQGHALSVSVDGPFAAGVPTDRGNLVWQAAELAGWCGNIELTKMLPHAAGLGSGSSDAAAVLRMTGAQVDADQILELGADVPVCMVAAASRMQGIGEDIHPVSLPSLPALLVNPGIDVPTGAVFAALSSKQNPAMPDHVPHFHSVTECAAWLGEMRNDLEQPALGAAPRIADVLVDLRGTRDVLLARMSGSGASCFAIYPEMNAAHFAAYEIGAAHPDWWCVATMLR